MRNRRKRLAMSAKRSPAEAQGRGQEKRLGEESLPLPAAGLRHVPEQTLGSMAPGDVVFLEDAESLRSAVQSIFFALLACPACGALGLITSAQYTGSAAITCGSSQCSCRFRIDEEGQFVYLPVN